MRWHAAHRHWSSSNVQAVYPTKHSFDCFSLNCMQKLIFMIPTCALTQFTCYSHVDVVFICRQNWQTQLIFFRVSLHVCKKYWLFTILKVAQFLTPCCIPHSLSLSLVNSHIVLFCKHIFLGDYMDICIWKVCSECQVWVMGINKVFSLSAWKSSEYHKNKQHLHISPSLYMHTSMCIVYHVWVPTD